MWKTLRAHLEARRTHPNLFVRKLFGLFKLLGDVTHQLYVDQAPRSAAALAYTTILSMVPLLAVSFAILGALVPSEELAQTVRDWLLNSLLASSVAEVTETLEQFLERAQGGAVGLVGFLFLLVSSLSLFLSVERAFNQIWRTPARRPLYRRLTSFYAVLTLAPALAALGVVAGRGLQSGLAVVPFGLSLSATALQWLLGALALSLMYKLLPHTPVRWWAAAIGGVSAAVAFELSKWGFNVYVNAIFDGSVRARIYGSFGLIPVFFIWVYLVWIIVLAGAEVAYMAQHRQALGYAVISRRGRRGDSAPTPYLVTRVFAAVAEDFRTRGGGTRPETVAARLELPPDEVEPSLTLLQEAGLLLPVELPDSGLGLLPARALDQILLSDLAALCEGEGYRPGELPAGPAERALEQKLKEAASVAKAALAVDVQGLLAPPAPNRRRPERRRALSERHHRAPQPAPLGGILSRSARDREEQTDERHARGLGPTRGAGADDGGGDSCAHPVGDERGPGRAGEERSKDL